MENSIKGRGIRYNLHQGLENAPGLYRPAPPPSLRSYIGWLRKFRFCNFAKILISCFAKKCLKFRKIKNYFDKIILSLANFEGNFTKHEIKNFEKFCNITKTKILQPPCPYSYTATHPPLSSARRFFNAARQCYFEMKTNTEPYFSILSSIILCFLL